uniref:Uncharacterized protein n=1 Tax=Oryza sativa subsp. japonica TaxID=39947 RepID=Q69LY6_ORYSJ|nr:hypothetical protein [Oryza sativa Japonica Group]
MELVASSLAAAAAPFLPTDLAKRHQSMPPPPSHRRMPPLSPPFQPDLAEARSLPAAAASPPAAASRCLLAPTPGREPRERERGTKSEREREESAVEEK